MRILLTDDNAELRDMLRFALVKHGHEVFVAQNGKEASELLVKIDPQALLTDIVMPDGEGLELIGAFRRLYPDRTVIAMSGGSEHLSGRLCLELAKNLGAKAALHKPFSIDDLLRALSPCPS